MSKLTEELAPQYVNSVLQYGADVVEMINKLQKKGEAFSETINSLDELEGAFEIKGTLRILLKCPMVVVLEAIKKANAELTGEEVLPDFYPKLVEEYIKKHPDEGAILHPLCIAHQQIRKAFGQKQGLEIQQIACRSGSTGKVVFSDKGLKEAGMTEEEARKAIGENACLYLCKRK
ncbi:MAG: hypothetical protein ABIG46_00600 [Candidatus Omnitrophota bacterium]|nr:hypothetical protein [Candidatus Omnitrophota bacterium]